jgi:hypothetical protein
LPKPAGLKPLVRRYTKLAVVPHAANQYRPHAIRRHGLVALLVVIIAIQAVYNFSATGAVLGARAPISPQALLADTNARRAERHLQPLRIDDRLSRAAGLKADDMFRQQYWAHVAPDGTTPWHWFGAAGYDYAAAGENLAKNFTTADATVTAWMSSPMHRQNILTPEYTNVGFAAVDGTLSGKAATLIVALYGKPAAAPIILGVAAPTAAPAPQAMSPVARLGVALKSMTPAAVASLFIAAIGITVALTAHAHRRKLPRSLRAGWYRHHGLVKAGGMLSLIIVMLFLYSGGQI